MEQHYEIQINELNNFINELIRDKDIMIEEKQNLQKQISSQIEQFNQKENNI